MLAPEFSWPVAVGDRISVVVELEAADFFGQPRQQLTVRSETDELLVWLGEARTVAGLHTRKELRLLPGDVACLGHHSCSPTTVGAWRVR